MIYRMDDPRILNEIDRYVTDNDYDGYFDDDEEEDEDDEYPQECYGCEYPFKRFDEYYELDGRTFCRECAEEWLHGQKQIKE